MAVNSVNGKSFFYEKVSANWNKTSIQSAESFGRAVSEISVQQNGRVNLDAVFECGVRRISYSESDSVKLFVTEGYSLKAKVEAAAHRVYVEQKNEDGSSAAYEVNPLKVSKDTKNPIEQIAVEAWEKARKSFSGGMVEELSEEGQAQEKEANTFEERLAEFQEFVKKRIKEGPPKIQIGGSDFTQEEWETLLRKIDKDIDAYKEELRERVQKEKQNVSIKRVEDILSEQKSLAGAAGVGVDEKKPDSPAVLEREAIEGSKEQTQRGKGFLARLSGEKKAPYSYLADPSGMIVYNGVTFVCDDKKQTISLGDMSNPNKVLNIPLSKGGCLRVNRDNLGDLVKAIDMFSPEDVARILRAIAQDKHMEEVRLEIEEIESKIVE